MSHLIGQVLTGAPPALVYLLVFLVPALEASIFVGFVLPGETAVLLGGAIASQGRVHLAGVGVAAVLGAVLGDTVGYVIGRRFGGPLQQSRLGGIVGHRRWDAAEDFLRRRGGPSVFLGRWTALLRALVPAAAGMAGLPYRTFAIWNVTGGMLWAAAMSVAGFLAGNAYQRLEKYMGDGALALLALIVVAVVVRHLIRERRSRSIAR
jgi:membrane-associated protein